MREVYAETEALQGTATLQTHDATTACYCACHLALLSAAYHAW